MRTRIFLLALLLLSIAKYSHAQTLIAFAKPALSKMWGYINIRGEIIIPPQFHMNKIGFPFSENGLAVVYDKTNNKYYFINTKGEKLATRITNFNLLGYEGFSADGFHDHLVAVTYNGRWGYLTDSGSMFIKAKYRKATRFDHGYAVVKDDSKFWVLDLGGHQVPVEASDAVGIQHFTEELAPYRTDKKKFGFIGISGETVIPAQFDEVGYFNHGVAWAESNGLTGFINKKGVWTIKPQFQACKDFDSESGMALVKKGDRWTYVNKIGEIVNIVADDLGNFSEGLAHGRKTLVGFFNNQGEWVIKPAYEEAHDFQNGYAVVKQNGLWGLIDKGGQWVIPATFAEMKDMERVN